MEREWKNLEFEWHLDKALEKDARAGAVAQNEVDDTLHVRRWAMHVHPAPTKKKIATGLRAYHCHNGGCVGLANPVGHQRRLSRLGSWDSRAGWIK
jgi:hypothetical protein